MEKARGDIMASARPKGIGLMFRRFQRWLYRGHRPNALARLLNRWSAIVFAGGIAPDYLVTLEAAGRR
jgi:hypothetical protein